jgi:hypothetical protein
VFYSCGVHQSHAAVGFGDWNPGTLCGSVVVQGEPYWCPLRRSFGSYHRGVGVRAEANTRCVLLMRDMTGADPSAAEADQSRPARAEPRGA